MSVSMAGFTINDVIVKAVAHEMSIAQVMLIRGAFATAMITLLAWQAGALRHLRAAAHPMVGLRIVGELGATVCFLTALSRLPLANVTSMLQALPLAVTMGAALFLSEPVGWRRWLAISVGFLGVMVIVRPGFDGFNVFSLLVLLCVCFCAVRDIATRLIPDDVPTLYLSTLTALVVALAGAVLIAPYGGWAPVGMSAYWLLFAASLLLLLGYHFIIMSMRIGEISFVAPFRYTALIWAILLGYLVFAEVPDIYTIVGASIIVGSGLYTLYRERVVARRKPVAVSTAPGMAPDGL